MSKKPNNILVIGSSNTDMVVKVPHLPKPGETVLGGTFQQISGGKGANQAVAAQRCGGQVAFLACIGDDSLGSTVLAAYQKDGIDINAIIIDKHQPSGVALIFVNGEGENSIAVASGANNALTKTHIDNNKDLIKGADVILFQLETPIETIEYAIAQAAQLDKTIILNPAPAQSLADEVLKNVSILTPNESEASLLTGINVVDAASAEQAADILLQKGIQRIIITMGESGVFLKDKTQQHFFEAYKVNAADTTAAGDTFNGALAAALATGEELFSAINFAQAAAALSVTKEGAQPSVPTKKEVLDFLQAYKDAAK